MAGLTDYAAQKLLQHIVGESSYASPSTWLALFTAAGTDAGTGFTEVSGGAYARVQVSGTEAANGSFTTSSTTITMAVSAPAWVVAGMNVHDATTGLHVGTVSSWSGTTLTLNAAAASASSGAADNLIISAFGSATGDDPSVITNVGALTFAASTASWGNVTAWGLYDASTAGNLLQWDYLGASGWYPFTCTNASPGVLTAPGITAGSSPVLANGALVELASEWGGAPPAGLSVNTQYTVAGLAADTFNVGTNTTSIGSGMVRQVVSQSFPSGITFSFQPGMLSLRMT